jgi:hypothetical protein
VTTSPRAAAAATPAATTAADEWWVDLALPPLAAVADAERGPHLARLQVQQDEVAARIRALGGTVTARVTHVRNALAVRIAADRVAELRAQPGVRQVTPVRHRSAQE